MRATFAVAIILGALATSGIAQENGDEAPPATDRVAQEPLEPTEERSDLTPAQLRDLAASLKINKALNEDASIDAVEQPLFKVLREISNEHKIPIVLDPEGLEFAAADTDHLVTITLDGVSLRNALRTLLKPLRLGFIVRNEVLTVTALDVPDRLATVRTFPLGRLTEQMDDPSELITTLEMIWPDNAERVGDDRVCEPRARVLANHLVVRGSPRHLDLAEQLIDGLMAHRSEPEVKATVKLPAGFKSEALQLPSKEIRKARPAPLRPNTPPDRPRPPEEREPEAALR